MYALIDISNQMLEDSAFDHAGASLRKAGLAVGAERLRMAVCSGSLVALEWPHPYGDQTFATQEGRRADDPQGSFAGRCAEKTRIYLPKGRVSLRFGKTHRWFHDAES